MILIASAQIIVGIVSVLIAYGQFIGAICYFDLTGKMDESSAGKTRINTKVMTGPGARLQNLRG